MKIIEQVLIFSVLVFFGWSYGRAQYTQEAADYFNTQNIDDHLYYIGEAFLFAFFCIAWLISGNSSYRHVWTIMATFLSIRMLWLIKAAVLGLNPNDPKIVAVLFIITVIIVLVIMLFPSILKIWHTQN